MMEVIREEIGFGRGALELATRGERGLGIQIGDEIADRIELGEHEFEHLGVEHLQEPAGLADGADAQRRFGIGDGEVDPKHRLAGLPAAPVRSAGRNADAVNLHRSRRREPDW